LEHRQASIKLEALGRLGKSRHLSARDGESESARWQTLALLAGHQRQSRPSKLCQSKSQPLFVAPSVAVLWAASRLDALMSARRTTLSMAIVGRLGDGRLIDSKVGSEKYAQLVRRSQTRGLFQLEAPEALHGSSKCRPLAAWRRPLKTLEGCIVVTLTVA